MTSTRIDFGNDLLSPGQLQPNQSIHIDAYGVAQGQATWALDSADGNISDAIAHFTAGVAWPNDIGFTMKSYKYSLASAKGGVTMMVVDYMGITKEAGYSDAQITGVANTTAQPIETHPNFTSVTDDTIGTGSATQILAGYYTDAKTHLTTANCPIFVEMMDNKGSPYVPPFYKFNGFGSNGAGAVNPKAGIRQFLRPMWNVRGVIFFDSDNEARVTTMQEGIGRTLHGFGDVNKLIVPDAIVGYVEPAMCLLASANVECIGSPSNYAALKVTYDLMIGGEIGWDTDIYGKSVAGIFA